MRTHIISSRYWFLLCLASLLFLSACGATSGSSSSATPGATATPTVSLDAYGTPIAIPPRVPQRIVSLAPSMSEILGALHLQSHIVGVDYYTNYPADVAKLQKVSDLNGTYNVETIVALKPDLVLSSGGLTKTADTQLAKLGLRVVDLPSVNFEQSLQQIVLVGQLTHTESIAKPLVSQLEQQVKQIETTVKGTISATVLLEVDDSTPGKPYVFGGGSFGDEMLQDINASNIFHSSSGGGGYPQVTDEAVLAANPQFVILTEDPAYGGNAADVYKRTNWSGIEALQKHQVYHINTDLMQRPGPRLVEGLRCLAQVVHADKFSGPLPDYCSASV